MGSFVDIVLAPGMRVVWLISAAILFAVWWINRRPDSASSLTIGGLPFPIQITPDPSESRARSRRFIVVLLVTCCLPAGMLVNVLSVFQHRHQSVLGWALILIALSHGAVTGTLKNSGLRKILDSIRRADYNAAIAEADRRLRWFPGSRVYGGMRALALHAAGRLEEAEQQFARGCAGSQGLDSRARALALQGLGDVWLDQGKFSQAQAAFEAAIRIDRNYGAPYCSLAEVFLRQGYTAEQALKLLDQGLELKERDKYLPSRYRRMAGDVWASRADALARLGRTSEAEASLAKAAEVADPETIPDMAGMLWRCGQALVHLGRESEAAAQFQRAAEIDPGGLNGKRSAAQLRQLMMKV